MTGMLMSQKNDVHLGVFHYDQSLRAVARFVDLLDLDACLPQGPLHDFSHHRGIVHDENLHLVHGLL